VLESILGADLLSVFSLADGAISSVRQLASCDANPEAERVLITILNSLLAIKDVATRLTFPPAPDPSHDENDGQPPLCSASMELCRICEKQVPLELFRAHTASCLARYKTEVSLASLNGRLYGILSQISEHFLSRVAWPPAEDMFPVLHFYLLLERVASLDAQECETCDELWFILTILRGIDRKSFSEWAFEAIELVHEKLRSSHAFSEANHIMKRTSIGAERERTSRRYSISEFEFVKKVSKGMYSTVFLAQKKSTGDIYAIKAISKKIVNKTNQRRILAERDILLKFNSPYVVQFFFSIIGKNNLYFVTEYLPGGDLYSLLQNLGSVDEHYAKIYAYEIIMGLKYLRALGIVHRDLKPDNILVSARGRLKLADFGLSSHGVLDWQANLPRSLVGTMDYIAPEIILNQAHSFAADYWSLGCLIWELVSGTPPFHAASLQETKEKIVLGKLTFSDDAPVSAEFRDLVSGLLTMDPSKRLGAHSIKEIIDHPWFAGVNPDTQGPPFVPSLTGQTDTAYFSQRYQFQPGEDASILDDFASELPVDDDDLSRFPAVNVDSLWEANQQVIRRSEDHIRSSKSQVFSSDALTGIPRKGCGSLGSVDSNTPKIRCRVPWNVVMSTAKGRSTPPSSNAEK
jgi:serine/threonine protein kinase